MIYTIYKVGFGIWNTLVGLAMTLFTTSPTAANGDVYTITHNLYLAISSISVPITMLFFLIAIIKEAVTTPPHQVIHKLLYSALKFCIMIGVLMNLWEIMGYIIQIADGITSELAGATPYQIAFPADLQNAINTALVRPTATIEPLDLGPSVIRFAGAWIDYIVKYLIFIIASAVTTLIMVASGLSVLSSAYQRIIKPLAILPFSSITVAMASGAGDAQRVTTSYLKTLFGFCLSGAFMVICIKLGNALTSGGGIFNLNAVTDAMEKMLYISIQTAINPIITAGLIKSSDHIIGRFF